MLIDQRKLKLLVRSAAVCCGHVGKTQISNFHPITNREGCDALGLYYSSVNLIHLRKNLYENTPNIPEQGNQNKHVFTLYMIGWKYAGDT